MKALNDRRTVADGAVLGAPRFPGMAKGVAKIEDLAQAIFFKIRAHDGQLGLHALFEVRVGQGLRRPL